MLALQMGERKWKDYEPKENLTKKSQNNNKTYEHLFSLSNKVYYNC